MSTNIPYTDEVWNPVTGCTKVSEGCRNCYAEAMTKRGMFKEKDFSKIVLHPERLEKPFHWKKSKRIFVNSMSDLYHEEVPKSFIGRVSDAMGFCKQHTFLVLTKRPDVMLAYYKIWEGHREFPIHNVWLGVTVENQKAADERIPLLLQTPAAKRWLSVEPLLGYIERLHLQIWFEPKLVEPIDNTPLECPSNKIDWVVVGCESGHKRRPCKVEWIESVVDQCKGANVPVFVKQIELNGKVISDPALFPNHLQLREFPK